MSRRSTLITAVAAAGAALVVIAIIASSGGLGSGSRHVVPELRGQRLDVAEGRLEAIGLASDTKGGGTFGVIVRSHWRVCDQNPLPGKQASSVLLVVDRECEWTVPDVTGFRLRHAKAVLMRAGTPFVVDFPGLARPRATAGLRVCHETPEYAPTNTPIQLTVYRVCELPDLTGLALTRAAERVRRTGIPLRAVTDTGRKVPIEPGWLVCEQDPSALSPASREKVVVYPTCALPDVSGMAVARAVRELRREGVAIRTFTVKGRTVSALAGWEVCEQEPSAFEAASVVTLTVGPDCAGPGGGSIAGSPLPYLEGSTADLARAQLDVIGVRYAVITSPLSRGVQQSLLTVCHQEPPAGSAFPNGRTAVLYLAADCYSEWPGAFKR